MKGRIVILLSVVLSVVTFTGCAKDDLKEAQATIQEYEAEIASLNTQVTELEDKLQSQSGINGDSETSISSYNKEAEVEEVGDVSSKVQVDGYLEYSGCFQAPNTASINLLSTATITPSNNWSVRIDGTTSYYTHPSGVVGVIKMSNISDEVSEEYYKSDFIDPFLNALPHEGEKTTRIYVDTTYSGITTETAVTGNEKPSILKFGVFGKGSTACAYCFYYEGKRDATKSELVDSLIKSMTLEKKTVRVE